MFVTFFTKQQLIVILEEIIICLFWKSRETPVGDSIFTEAANGGVL